MLDADFIEILKNRVNTGLPGEEAQLKMAPVHRKPLAFYGKNTDTATRSAVLLPLFRMNGELSTLLIKRQGGGIHASQIALPGGKCEPEDIDVTATALREAQEEVSILPADVTVIGSMTPVYIPPSHYIVTPVIGWYEGETNFRSCEREISELYIIPLKVFSDKSRIIVGDFTMHTGQKTEAPAYRLDQGLLWGATAMIFAEFTELCKDLI